MGSGPRDFPIHGSQALSHYTVPALEMLSEAECFGHARKERPSKTGHTKTFRDKPLYNLAKDVFSLLLASLAVLLGCLFVCWIDELGIPKLSWQLSYSQRSGWAEGLALSPPLHSSVPVLPLTHSPHSQVPFTSTHHVPLHSQNIPH